MSLIQRQLAIEKQANDFSYERLMKEIRARVSSGQGDELAEGKLILVHSIELVAKKIEEYFELDIRGKMKGARDLIALEYYDTPRDLAYIILVTIVRSISRNVHVPSTSLIKQINRSIYDATLIRKFDRGGTTLGAFVDKRYKRRSEAFRNQEKIKMAKKQEQLVEPDLNDITTYLGGMLLDLVIKSGAGIIEKKSIRKRGKTTQHIIYTEECFRMVLQSRERLLVEYRRFPILIAKPRDWESFEGSGGYYNKEIYKLPLIKAHGSSRRLLRDYFKQKKPTQLYEVLNTLQSTAWMVNKRVFDVLDFVFQNNIKDPESAYNNPSLLGKLPYNGKLEAEDFINVHNYGEIDTSKGRGRGLPVDPKKTREFFRDLEDQEDIISSIRGRAFMLSLVMYNAREYLNEEQFFFTYQYDFRSRVNPIQQHLQPQGRSEVKALLQFKEGCPLSEDDESLFWFLVHGANCFGLDGKLYSERVETILGMKEDIKLIAEDPIKFQTLWKDTDEPYMFLAWCFEYADYLKDPENFLSYLPLSLDATCSGIQIYSGLLRDRVGASAVNVIGSTRNDIYGDVADKVNEYLYNGEYPKMFSYTDSAEVKHTVYTQAIVDSLKGLITRTLTKRNTMTQPYSVTKFGMYEQLIEELAEQEKNNKKFWIGENWKVAKILTDLNDRAITEVVKGARVGQEFLKEVTRQVVKDGGWVFYTTPVMGFPVLQKIHKTTLDRINTPIGKLSIRRVTDVINPAKMVNGIAPNFVHSLDATLLAMTVIKLKADGCSNFLVIHDSYGVPANQVANLNRRFRESFVTLFQEDPLRQWVSQVDHTFAKEAEDVMINTLDLEEIYESEYIIN